jgi:hypothetical protein
MNAGKQRAVTRRHNTAQHRRKRVLTAKPRHGRVALALRQQALLRGHPIGFQAGIRFYLNSTETKLRCGDRLIS